MHEAIHGSMPENVRVLITAGANINARDNDGITPLYVAVYLGKLEATKTLVNAGADTSITDSRGRTALDYALDHGRSDFVKILSEAENRHAKTLGQTLKDRIHVEGNTVNLDPARYTVVRADRSQGLGWVQDLKEAGLKPAAVVAEKETTTVVLKHAYPGSEKEGKAISEKLDASHPGLAVSQGGTIKPTMVLEATGASIDMQKFMHTMIRDYSPAKGKGMER